MKKLSFLLLLLIGLSGFGQCPAGDVLLNSQTDVDNFLVNYPNCNQVAGALEYRFRFNGLTYNDRPTFTNTLNIAGMLSQSTTYNVDVAAKVGGVWGDYGAICQLTSPSMPYMMQLEKNEIGSIKTIRSSDSAVSFDRGNQNNISVYPNPAKDQFILSTDLEFYMIKLYSTNGQLVYTSTNLGGTQTVDVTTFDPGLYILQIVDR